jgi:hypothetical protein
LTGAQPALDEGAQDTDDHDAAEAMAAALRLFA